MHRINSWHVPLVGTVTAIPLLIVDPAGIIHILTLFCVIVAGIIGIVATLVVWLFRRRRGESYGHWAAACAFVMVIHLVAYYTGVILSDYQVAQAKSYCEMLIPRVDSVQTASGRYPAEIDPLLGSDPDLPLLLERAYDTSLHWLANRSSFYSADSSSYSFDFPGPSLITPYDIWRWRSDSRSWIFDD